MAYQKRKATNATASMGGTSAAVMAANEQRKFAEFFNGSDVSIWLALGAAAVVGTGIHVPVGASYVIDDHNMYLGAVNGIAASGSGKAVGTLELS